LLKCTSAYPTPMEDVNLNIIPDLKKKFKTLVGISDHSLSSDVPIAAVALGAKIVEKHFILDKNIDGPDSTFSIEPKEFGEMVRSIRDVEKALGSVSYKLTSKMKKNREFGRSLFVTEDVKKGEKFTLENIRSVRPAFGMHPKYYFKILKKKASKNIKRGTPLKSSLIS